MNRDARVAVAGTFAVGLTMKLARFPTSGKTLLDSGAELIGTSSRPVVWKNLWGIGKQKPVRAAYPAEGFAASYNHLP